MIQDLSGSWCIKGTGESMARVDSSVSLMHHEPDRSWITDPDPDHPKGTHFKIAANRGLRVLVDLLPCISLFPSVEVRSD